MAICVMLVTLEPSLRQDVHDRGILELHLFDERSLASALNVIVVPSGDFSHVLGMRT